jgi:hypothetical protein
MQGLRRRRGLVGRRPRDQVPRSLHGDDAGELLQRALGVAAGRSDAGLEGRGIERVPARNALPRFVDDLCVLGHAGRVTASNAIGLLARDAERVLGHGVDEQPVEHVEELRHVDGLRQIGVGACLEKAVDVP